MQIVKGQHTVVSQKWLDGISYEIAFWANVYRWPHTFRGLMEWSNYRSSIKLDGFNANAFLQAFPHPKVYDVGCGMSYAIGDHIERNGKLEPIEVHYVDPLAFHFNKILRRTKKDLPQIEFGMSEYLSAFIPSKDASLITIQNALDHSSAPIKGIIEALMSLNESGVLYLNHRPNEAEMEDYKGFHQYNVDERNGDLIIWNKTQTVNITQLLDGFASIETKRIDSDGHIIAIISRLPGHDSLPDRLQPYVNDKADKGELCQVLLQYQYRHTSLFKHIMASLHFAVLNAGQCFIQMLPWSLKMKVKRLIKQA